MISNYTTLDLILERLNTTKIPGQDISKAEIKEWTWEALSKIGAISEFINTTIEIEIIDGKGQLPSTIHTLYQVQEGSSGFDMDEVDANQDYRELSYKLNAGFIFTSFETGSVLLQVAIFPVDDNNDPLIPDDVYFISAVVAFNRFKLGEISFLQGKLDGNRFNYLERQWMFYCPAAKNASKMPSLSKLNSIKKQILHPIPNLHKRLSRGYSTRDTIK